jgi:uncharacterized protein HemX
MSTQTRTPATLPERPAAANEVPEPGPSAPEAPSPQGSALVTAVYLVALAACLAVCVAAAVGLAR